MINEGGGRVGPTHVLEGRQHAVRDQHRRPDPAEHVNLLTGRGGGSDQVLDAEPTGDLGRHHDVRVIGEPVRPRHHRHPAATSAAAIRRLSFPPVRLSSTGWANVGQARATAATSPSATARAPPRRRRRAVSREPEPAGARRAGIAR